ncbi:MULTISPECIES: ferredoxin [unclassified Streptomyces]|uniref:ferredoxin n=1 Tax=unclassified Streptomyces TaxID=2593676 RepID=UPI001F04397E|nr:MULTISPECIES: ferredoxin [unclassified Streptomyces]MCH0566873.1 ferredoxin [Streptomyces sp. MUM 2J]MCH0569830.1 ferredoxin [Streptomyces sp. MUM 136J]
MTQEKAPRVQVKRDACIGAGLCAVTAPAVFDQSEDTGLVVLLDATPGVQHLTSLRQAVASCPAHALGLEE